MKELLSCGATIILVSHSDASTKEICQRVILLEHGSIVMDGPNKQVVNAFMSTEPSEVNPNNE